MSLCSRIRQAIDDQLRSILFMDRGSLATATALRVLVVGGILTLIISLVVFDVSQKRESKRLLNNVNNLVSTVEATARIACFTGDKTLAAEVVKGLLENSFVAGVRVTSGSAVLSEANKYHYASGEIGKEASVVRKMFSPFSNNEIVGEIQLFADDEQILAQANGDAWLIVLMSIFEVLIVSLMVAWMVLRRIVFPLKDFSSKLEKIDIESGKFVMSPAGNELNEIGHLTLSFNGLLSRLSELVQNEKNYRVQIEHKESSFRALAENSPNMISRYDHDCRRIYCNPAYYEKYSLPSGSAQNTKPEQLWRVENLSPAEYQKILRRVMKSGQSVTVLLEWTGGDGNLISNDFHIVPETDANGKVSNVVAIGHDISLLKKQQRLDTDRSLVLERIVRGGALSELLVMIVAHVERTITGHKCAILLWDEQKKCSRIGAATNLPEEFLAIANQYFQKILDVSDTNLYSADFQALGVQHGLHVDQCIPILNAEGSLLGMLMLYQGSLDIKAEVDMSYLLQACNLAAISIDRKRIEDLVQHHASYDALTNLPNRRMFGDKLHEEISKTSRNAGNVTLLFLDLDRFKAVNDTMGHEVGDMLLVEAAVRIQSCVRGSDMVARLGGDEFVVLIPNEADISHFGRVAKKIVDVLCHPFELNGHIAYVSASVGIASYPSDADSADKLVSCADQSMYAAKEAGRNGFCFYSAELSFRANERLDIEQALRHSIQRGELELYYQPKVSLVDGMLIGSEALLRWKHPQRGMVPPDEFIFIAEDSGLIVDIGEWVLRDACRVACEWNSHGKPLHKVAINLSARQFKSNDLVKTVRKVLGDTRCQPEWIELEITESLLLDEGGEVLATLGSFRELGITIAIDDFGTGYSSLSYLARFPIDTLKIDRSFISKVTEGGHHSELVKAIISIANSLNQKVVAEGVETVEQAAVLQKYGCDIAQGYLYSKPISKAAFETLPGSFEMAQKSFALDVVG